MYRPRPGGNKLGLVDAAIGPGLVHDAATGPGLADAAISRILSTPRLVERSRASASFLLGLRGRLGQAA